MTERLASINARIAGIRELAAVVNAMRGIAGARAQQARAQLTAVDSYAAIIARGIGRVLAAAPIAPPATGRRGERSAAVVFCAEQGFAGAFSKHVLSAVPPGAELFLVGTRGATIATEGGITARWTSAMPAATAGIPSLARRIAEALYGSIAEGRVARLDAIYGQWHGGQGLHVLRAALFPLDAAAFPRPADANMPLLNLAPEVLLRDLTADYIHAELCRAALHAFAAENEARMETMAAAHRQIEARLCGLELTQQVVRQQEITAEIIELATGEMAGRACCRTRC
ncbi:MAG TPA: F0F1 ATP synthase subunit gamma [Acidocella sp.]|nr:F0F1 ATP synthase subunit gamma [Acidocella sp.]HUM09103.1 F0F1 ATP synthase subunit gamma [Acidocella sp.]